CVAGASAPRNADLPATAGLAFAYGRFRYGRVGRRRILAGARGKECTHGLAGNRVPKQPPLRFGATETGKRGADLLGFDAFGGDRHVKVVTQASNCVDERRGLVAVDHRRDETLVDLDAVERQAIDLRKRRIASPEIVE